MSEQTALVERAMTISEFCQRNNMAGSTYHALKNGGVGPAEMRFGRWVRISPEAELHWRRMMENPTPEQAAAIAASRVKLRQRAREAARAAVASKHHVSKRSRS